MFFFLSFKCKWSVMFTWHSAFWVFTTKHGARGICRKKSSFSFFYVVVARTVWCVGSVSFYFEDGEKIGKTACKPLRCRGGGGWEKWGSLHVGAEQEERVGRSGDVSSDATSKQTRESPPSSSSLRLPGAAAAPVRLSFSLQILCTGRFQLTCIYPLKRFLFGD